MKKVIKLNESDLEKIVKRVINEGPYDEIGFDFLDREDEEKAAIKLSASESLYNKMAKDVDILKEIYHIFVSSQSIEEAFNKFKNSQYMNRVENYMEELYRIPELNKISGSGEIFNLCQSTFNKFFHDAINAAKKRYDRLNNGNL